jgi:hypothetical protein
MNILNLRRHYIVLLSILMISGCSTFRFAPTPPTLYTQHAYTAQEYDNDLRFYNAPNADQAVRTRYRNKIVYSTAMELDRNYNEFKNSFFAERASIETSLDIVQIGLSSAGTLAAGETTKAILAAIATGVAGSRLSFNKNFFKEKSPDLLISRMDALRAQHWAQIYLKLQKQDDTYSLYEAERDLFAYYEAGSLQAAFQNIIAESGAAQKTADEEIWAQIERHYGARMGALAKATETRNVDKLYQQFHALPIAEREKQATKVIESYRKTMRLKEDSLIDASNPNASDLDNVYYLYSLAIRENYPDVRKALTEAFNEAKSP